MQERQDDFEEQFIPVPNQFHSFLEDGPFKNCLVCGKHLLDAGARYFIEKAFSRGETILESAICIDCYLTMMNDLSVESRQRIQKYFMDRVNLEERQLRLRAISTTDAGPWLETCLLSGRNLSALSEYQICAQCQGPNMYFGVMPFMISGQSVHEILELFSEQTRRTHDGWINQFFGVPPGMKQTPFVLV